MIDEQLFHVGVKGLITNAKGQILLMDEDVSRHSTPITKYWDMPGGRVKEGETILDTLYREIEEETGITEVKEPKFFTAVLSNHTIKLSDELTVALILMIYRVKIPADAEVRLSDEHLGCEWVSIAEAKKRLAHKYPQEFTDLL